MRKSDEPLINRSRDFLSAIRPARLLALDIHASVKRSYILNRGPEITCVSIGIVVIKETPDGERKIQKYRTVELRGAFGARGSPLTRTP